MDASRAYYDSLKTYDPLRELWKSLVERSSRDASLATLSKTEQRYFAVSLLEGEVFNGGFDQFFSNSSGDYYQLAVDGLQELGALSSLGLVKEAAHAIFGEHGPPADRTKRWEVMDARAQKLSDVLKRYEQTSRLDDLDEQFCRDPDQLQDRLRAYAEQEGLIIPFLKEPND